MSLYFALMKMIFQQQFAYRSEIFFRLVGNILRVMIQVSIWTTLLGVGGVVGDITLLDMVTFTIISIVIRILIYSNIASTFAKKVKTGQIVIDFIKPVSIKAYMFTEQISENAFNFIVIGLPLIFFSQFTYGFKIISDIYLFALFLISLILGLVIMFYIDYVLAIFIFWVKNDVYVHMIGGALFEIFSGAFIPLWFYPDFLVEITKYLPFRLVAFEPINIYLGKLQHDAVYSVILLQIFWVAMLYFIEKIVWRTAQNKVFIQGG